MTLNDLGDGDSGPNGLQNFPVLTGVGTTVTGTTIRGTLNSTANTTFTLEFSSSAACDPSGFGEGAGFVGATFATTDGGGNAAFVASFSPGAPPGSFITATATDASGSTSEFSRCLSDDVIFRDGFQTPGLSAVPLRERGGPQAGDSDSGVSRGRPAGGHHLERGLDLPSGLPPARFGRHGTQRGRLERPRKTS